MGDNDQFHLGLSLECPPQVERCGRNPSTGSAESKASGRGPGDFRLEVRKAKGMNENKELNENEKEC